MEAMRLHNEPAESGAELPLLPEWREFAACRDEPADVFFEESTEGIAEAKAICDGCVVVSECRADALELPWLVGVFGGLTETERRQVRADQEPTDRGRLPRARQAAAAAAAVPDGPPPPVEDRRKPCGTPAAYARHLRRGEQACDDCLEAQRLKSAEAHRRRRERAQEARGDADVPEAA